MAGYRIRADMAAALIELTDFGVKKEQFLETFRECQAGRCACPTDEYGKLASMEVAGAGDSIRVRLEVKPGEKLDAAQIETCLEYTTTRLQQRRCGNTHIPPGVYWLHGISECV